MLYTDCAILVKYLKINQCNLPYQQVKEKSHNIINL